MSELLSGYMCFVIDDDYHHYLIPIEYKAKFYQWLDDYYLDEDFDYGKFDECRVNTSVSNIAFKNHYVMGD